MGCGWWECRLNLHVCACWAAFWGGHSLFKDDTQVGVGSIHWWEWHLAPEYKTTGGLSKLLIHWVGCFPLREAQK